jgi:hypothetical protein
MSEYSVKYTRTDVVEVEVTVEGAETEEAAQAVADMHVDLGEGKYRVSGTYDVYVNINETVQDSETELDEDSPEWEPDEDDES